MLCAFIWLLYGLGSLFGPFLTFFSQSPFFTRTSCNYIWSGPACQSLRGKEKQRREMQPGNQPHASWVLREVQKMFFFISNPVPVSFLHRLVENCAGSVLREWILEVREVISEMKICCTHFEKWKVKWKSDSLFSRIKSEMKMPCNRDREWKVKWKWLKVEMIDDAKSFLKHLK